MLNGARRTRTRSRAPVDVIVYGCVFLCVRLTLLNKYSEYMCAHFGRRVAAVHLATTHVYTYIHIHKCWHCNKTSRVVSPRCRTDRPFCPSKQALRQAQAATRAHC